MDRRGQTVFTPTRDCQVAAESFLDFTSGYVQRAAALLPKQGDLKPWRLYQDYLLDLLALRFGMLADSMMASARGGRG
jgi:monooxygenase